MQNTHRIDFNRPQFAGRELEYITCALQSGHISGDGQFTAKCSALLEEELGAAKVLLTTSCTHALEMSAILLDIREGDEVIVPSFTFVSTANAFALRGAKLVFADVRKDTLNIDEDQISKLITTKTKAIVPVHYAGIGCEMEVLSTLAEKNQVAIVEDNAHGLFAKYKGKQLGTFGAMSTLSFHETKNFQCGEGGALVINDPSFIERAEIIREKGTNRKKFFRGQIDKYSWVDIGSSFLPSDILAAFLFAQLEARLTIQAHRKKVWKSYYEGLKDWAQCTGAILPHVPSDRESSHHIFHILLRNLEERQAFIAHMNERNIGPVHHYVPLHNSEMGMTYGYKTGSLPVTEDISDRLVRLPLHNGLSIEDVERVINSACSFNSPKSVVKI